ncbi:hypothetical protein DPMN_044992 [Dreissena polymorpha]|uniref:Uncharacterized protein n=1 Tax=Dreissena polymorpha TaxID=45954 RepID=A0A9D4D3G5_DREPO|nr:hypothetical protein DPMN_044992 [Dreissena polymorpha]
MMITPKGKLTVNIKIEHIKKISWISSIYLHIPAYSARRRQYEVSCIDSSHLLTRMRRKCCKGGLDGCSNTAWLTVAKYGRTNFTVAMTECIIDQMSVPTALTHFSESAELELIRNGYVREAELPVCRDFRQWWKSEDDPGISARNRIQMRLPLRRRLLRNLNLGQFPPQGMFVAGWPNQLLEAVMLQLLLNHKRYNLNYRIF